MVTSAQQSAGPQKEEKPKKGAKGKKKSFDTTQSSNPKQKYRQKGKNKGTSSLVEQAHKQKAPQLVAVHESEAVKSESTPEAVEDMSVPTGQSEQEEQKEAVLVEERTDMKRHTQTQGNDFDRTEGFSSKTEAHTTGTSGPIQHGDQTQSTVEDSELLNDHHQGSVPAEETGSMETNYRDSKETPAVQSSSDLDSGVVVSTESHQSTQDQDATVEELKQNVSMRTIL